MNNTDALITEADIEQAKADITTREWHRAIYALHERETDLCIYISGQLAIIYDLIEAAGAPPQLKERLTKRLTVMLWTSLIVLDRSHRRLWSEFLPDDESSSEGGAR